MPISTSSWMRNIPRSCDVQYLMFAHMWFAGNHSEITTSVGFLGMFLTFLPCFWGPKSSGVVSKAELMHCTIFKMFAICSEQWGCAVCRSFHLIQLISVFFPCITNAHQFWCDHKCCELFQDVFIVPCDDQEHVCALVNYHTKIVLKNCLEAIICMIAEKCVVLICNVYEFCNVHAIGFPICNMGNVNDLHKRHPPSQETSPSDNYVDYIISKVMLVHVPKQGFEVFHPTLTCNGNAIRT